MVKYRNDLKSAEVINHNKATYIHKHVQQLMLVFIFNYENNIGKYFILLNF